jgi:hypothetical protein
MGEFKGASGTGWGRPALTAIVAGRSLAERWIEAGVCAGLFMTDIVVQPWGTADL